MSDRENESRESARARKDSKGLFSFPTLGFWVVLGGPLSGGSPSGLERGLFVVSSRKVLISGLPSELKASDADRSGELRRRVASRKLSLLRSGANGRKGASSATVICLSRRSSK
jgi:hypothetical protein